MVGATDNLCTPLTLDSQHCLMFAFCYIFCLQAPSDEKYMPPEEIWLYDPDCSTW